MDNSNGRISANSVALAGEFTVLSKLALYGFDANMTLGRTKGVDILVSDPRTDRLFQLEVKTNLDSRKKPPQSKVHGGPYLTDWIMGVKHENIVRPQLWYCFVQTLLDSKQMRFFLLPSAVVAAYVKAEHKLWLDSKPPGKKDNDWRLFRIGLDGERYRIPTPLASAYEDNWDFSLRQPNKALQATAKFPRNS